MHAVVRTYSGTGAKKLADVLEEHKKDVEKIMSPIKGFASYTRYTLLRTSDGCVSVTVCNDKAGTDESLRVAADWIKKNASNTGASAPTVSKVRSYCTTRSESGRHHLDQLVTEFEWVVPALLRRSFS